MQWKSHLKATEVASRVFPAYEPKVWREPTGKLCRLSPTPYGSVELLRTEEDTFLVGAERPPRTEASIRSIALPSELVKRWKAVGLQPWKVIGQHCRDVCDAIAALTEVDQAGDEPAPAAADASLLPPPPTRKLIGAGRILLAERLATLTEAHHYPQPVLQLAGPDGIGRRTLAAALGDLGFSLIGELPLGRLALSRAFFTPGEVVNDALLAMGEQMASRDVLLASDAEVLVRLDPSTRGQLLRELSRLPHVILIATGMGRIWTRGVLTFRVGGLEPQEARDWISAEYPEIRFAGAAMDLLLRVASLPRSGEVWPGRIRWLIELSRALVSASIGLRAGDRSPDEESFTGRTLGENHSIVVSPDEITASAALVNASAWKVKKEPR